MVQPGPHYLLRLLRFYLADPGKITKLSLSLSTSVRRNKEDGRGFLPGNVLLRKTASTLDFGIRAPNSTLSSIMSRPVATPLQIEFR